MDALIIAATSSGIAAIATIAAACVTGILGYKTTRFKKDFEKKATEIERLKGELRRLYRQVAAYHELETICADKLASLTSCSARTMKTELRDSVETTGAERPELTRGQCEKRIRELEI